MLTRWVRKIFSRVYIRQEVNNTGLKMIRLPGVHGFWHWTHTRKSSKGEGPFPDEGSDETCVNLYMYSSFTVTKRLSKDPCTGITLILHIIDSRSNLGPYWHYSIPQFLQIYWLHIHDIPLHHIPQLLYWTEIW